MHIHLPKPLHGWREFLGEVGIIVIGVLIALGAEQAIESVHWSHRVRDAKEGMLVDLRDNAQHAYERVLIGKCATDKLTQLKRLLLSGVPLKEQPGLSAAYEMPARPWSDDGWTTAVASGAVAHMAPEEMQTYAEAYFLARSIRENQAKEQQSRAELSMLPEMKGVLANAARDRQLSAIAQALYLNEITSVIAARLIERTRALGITLSEDQRNRVLSGRYAQACRDRGEP